MGQIMRRTREKKEETDTKLQNSDALFKTQETWSEIQNSVEHLDFRPLTTKSKLVIGLYNFEVFAARP